MLSPWLEDRARRISLALAVAASCHALALLWLGRATELRRPHGRPASDVHIRARPEVAPGPATASTPVTLVALAEVLPAVAVVPATPGSHDTPSTALTHPTPGAEIDLPGQRAASRGGGALGGTDSWTGRHDRENRASQIWNDPDRNRLPRQALDRAPHTPSSPESIVRAREHGFDDRTESRRLARPGNASATRSSRASDADRQRATPHSLPAQPRWDEADPVLTGPGGASRQVAGRVGPRGQALADSGEAATEAPRHGPTRDTLNVASASNATDPARIELTAPGNGGDEQGVAGKTARPGVARRGNGPGDGATTAHVTRGSAILAVEALRQDPYFRHMYEAIDRHVVFPRELALSLDQGEVVVGFTLAASGQISNLVITKTSGFTAFDKVVIEAIRTVAPFARVPDSVLRGHRAIRVSAPYAFRNPIIR